MRDIQTHVAVNIVVFPEQKCKIRNILSLTFSALKNLSAEDASLHKCVTFRVDYGANLDQQNPLNRFNNLLLASSIEYSISRLYAVSISWEKFPKYLISSPVQKDDRLLVIKV